MELFATLPEQLLASLLAMINIGAFFVIGNDKRKSAHGRNTERVPEGFMFFLAIIFGGLGVYLGILAFRHKTRKWYFQIGVPLLILQNLVTVYVLWGWLV